MSANTSRPVNSRSALHQIDGAGDQHDQRNVERKEAGLRPFGAPADPDLEAADDADHGQQRHEQRDADFDRPVGRTRPTGTVRGFTHRTVINRIATITWARKPAAFIRSSCRFSSLATQPRYSFPVMKLWLKAPSLISFFHSSSRAPS